MSYCRREKRKRDREKENRKRERKRKKKKFGWIDKIKRRDNEREKGFNKPDNKS